MEKKSRVKKSRKKHDIFKFVPISDLPENIIIDNEIAYSLYLGNNKSAPKACQKIINYWEKNNLNYSATIQNLSKKNKNN